MALVLAVPGSFSWPVTPPQVTRRFEAPPQPWLAGHRGVDLGGRPGLTVEAAAGGTVVFAGRVAGRGVVSVAHAGGLRSTYEPVTASVAAGDAVTAGEPLGVLEAGHAGCPVSACLHWGVRRGRDYLDPLTLLGLGPVRLLPMPGVEQAG
ncbi:murein hydrolase activator EnvC family protein [Actinoplanes sp. NPDC020271]|uniref:murein hydrolase activator EnvC family protein n=1 Tax=Actinoplanes sp. NPDC020271 TaxID=3363896 RepID=UPI0037BC7C36